MKNNNKLLDVLIVTFLMLSAGIAVWFFASNIETTKEYKEQKSEYIPMKAISEPTKDVNEGVNTTLNNDIKDSADTISEELDNNGIPIEESTYIDSDGDTVPNANDLCDGIDDFSSECE